MIKNLHKDDKITSSSAVEPVADHTRVLEEIFQLLTRKTFRENVLHELTTTTSCVVRLFSYYYPDATLPNQRYTAEDLQLLSNQLNIHLNVVDGETCTFFEGEGFVIDPESSRNVFTLTINSRHTHAISLCTGQSISSVLDMDVSDFNLGMSLNKSKKSLAKETGIAVGQAIATEKRELQKKKNKAAQRQRSVVPTNAPAPRRNPPARRNNSYLESLLQQILGPSEMSAKQRFKPIPDGMTNAEVHCMQSRIEVETAAVSYGTSGSQWFKGFMSGYSTKAQYYETGQPPRTDYQFVIANFQTTDNNISGGFSDPIPCYDDRIDGFSQNFSLGTGTSQAFTVPLHSATDVGNAGSGDIAYYTPSEVYVSGVDTPLTFNPGTQIFQPPNSAFMLNADAQIVFSFDWRLLSSVPAAAGYSVAGYFLTSTGTVVVDGMDTGILSTHRQSTYNFYSPGATRYALLSVVFSFTSTTGNIVGYFENVKVSVQLGSGTVTSRTVFLPWALWTGVEATSAPLSQYFMKERMTSLDMRLNDTTADMYRAGTMSISSYENGGLDYNGCTGISSSKRFLNRRVFLDKKGVYGSSTPLFNPENIGFDKYGYRHLSPGAFQVIMAKPRPTYPTPPLNVPLLYTSVGGYEYVCNAEGNAAFNPVKVRDNPYITKVLKNETPLGGVMSENPMHTELLKRLVTAALKNAGSIGRVVGGRGSRAEKYGKKISQAANLFM